MLWLFLIMGIVVIIVLAIIAFRLTQEVKKNEQQSALKIQAEEKEKLEKQAFVVKSINIISINVIEQDLNLSEATIRCKMLLDSLMLSEFERKPFSILEEVYLKIKDLDTHETRKNLTGLERALQDEMRQEIEDKYKKRLVECFNLLQHFEGKIERS